MKKRAIIIRVILLLAILVIGATIVVAKEKTKEDSKNVTQENKESITYEEIPTIEQSMAQEKEEQNSITQIANNTQNQKDRKEEKAKSIPVLMYHFFYDAKKGEKGKDNNFVEISMFEKQMKYLAENDYYFPSWKEVEDFIDGKIGLPKKSIVITIDDGDESFFRLAVPILEQYKILATSFVVTTWTYSDKIQEYTSEYITFESHSNDMHRAGKDGKGRMLTMAKEEIIKDVRISQKEIGEATVFCYPFGHFNEKGKSALKQAGYQLAFTTKGGKVTPKMDKLQLPRVRISRGDNLKEFTNRIK